MTDLSRRNVLESAIAGIGVAALPSIARADDEDKVTGHGNLILPSTSHSDPVGGKAQAGRSDDEGGNRGNALGNRGNWEPPSPPSLHELSITFRIGSGSDGPSVSSSDRAGWEDRVGSNPETIVERANEKLMEAGVAFVGHSLLVIEQAMKAFISGPAHLGDPDIKNLTFGFCDALDVLKLPAPARIADLWSRIAEPFQLPQPEPTGPAFTTPGPGPFGRGVPEFPYHDWPGDDLPEKPIEFPDPVLDVRHTMPLPRSMSA